MEKLTLLRDLLSKETDDSKKKTLEEEILKTIREEEAVKAQKDAEAKVADERKTEKEAAAKDSSELAKLRSMFGGMASEVASDGSNAGSGIQVGTPGTYKGYKFRAEVAALTRKRPNDKHAEQRALWAGDMKAAERFAKSFLDIVDAGLKNPGRDLDFHAKAGMNEGTTTAGGYLTPDEFSDEWSSYVRDESVALRYCRLENMLSDVKYINKENGTVFSLGGIGITSEATAATEVDPTVDRSTLTAKRLDGYVRVTNEDLEDARVAGGFINQLLDQFAEGNGQKVDSAVFVGTGDPVSGVFLSAGYSEVFSTGSSNFSALLLSNVLNLIAAVKKAGPNRNFFLHHTILWKYLYGLADTTGRPIFIPSPSAGVPGTVFGYNAIEVPMAPETSAASTGYILWGDLRGFVIGVRKNVISFFVDPYTRGLSHETIFAMFNRYAFAQHMPYNYGRIVTAA